MKKIIFILILLLGGQKVFSQKRTIAVGIQYNNKFSLINNTTYNGKDTLVIKYFDNGNIRYKGKYAINNNGKVSDLKVGKWTEYFSNGRIQSEGNYEISSFIGCSVGGLVRVFYNYKLGEWSYFYPNGILKAKGKYKLVNARIGTPCGRRGVKLIFMTVTKDWKLPDSKQFDKRELQSVFEKTEHKTFTEYVEYYYNPKKNKVIMNYGVIKNGG